MLAANLSAENSRRRDHQLMGIEAKIDREKGSIKIEGQENVVEPHSNNNRKMDV